LQIKIQNDTIRYEQTHKPNGDPMKPFVFALMATLTSALALPCQAQKRVQTTFPEQTAGVVLLSAKACYIEATWSFDDCTALLHVIRKRATKMSFVEMLHRYSVVNWRGKEASQMKSVKRASNPDKSYEWNKKWFELIEHVVLVLSGSKQDPCPSAKHWAAPSFIPRIPMQRVSCKQPTKNFFWREM
jgi:hypothetical protein